MSDERGEQRLRVRGAEMEMMFQRWNILEESSRKRCRTGDGDALTARGARGTMVKEGGTCWRIVTRLYPQWQEG